MSRWILSLWILSLAFAGGFSLYIVSNHGAQGQLPTPTAPPPTESPVPTTTTTPKLGRAAQPPPAANQPTAPAKPLVLSPTPPTVTPSEPERIVIGHSVAGRPLEVYQFGSGEIERLIVAGIHGGYESNTINLADELIQHLRSQPHILPPEVTLYILRAFNPDGEARSHGIAGRANENGVDLNRNFPNRWQADWPLDGCWRYAPITAGAEPASEPETKALMSFIHEHDIDALISYHSAALGIFPGGQPPSERSLSLAEDIASVSEYPYPPLDLGCLYTGQLIDWAADQGIAAVDIELANHDDTDFKQNLIILYKFLNWRQD